MSDTSPILALPLIQPAQAQKHVTHNEALRLLDVLVQTAVLTRGNNTPPATPAIGERHITGAAPIGAWAGQPGRIAVWEDPGGWFFLTPLEGWTAHVVANDAPVTFIDGQWVAAADQTMRVARLGIGTDADATNRLAAASPATLLTHVGAGHQVKVNKSAVGDAASLLFQTNWSGRAEMGTVQSDDFAIKVSADGVLFRDGLTVAGATGVVSLPQGALVADGSAALPGLGFTADTDTGLLRPGADQIGWATGGVQRLLLTTTGVSATVPVLAPAGSAAAPTLSFSGDTDTGMLSPGANQLGWSTGGTQRLLLSTTALTATVPALAPAGSAAAPSLSFSGDTNTGLFSAAADAIGWAVNGTERTRLTTAALRLGDTATTSGAFGWLQVQGDAVSGAASVSIVGNAASASGPMLILSKTRAAAAGGATIVQAGDTLGTIRFTGADGTDVNNIGADILCTVTGTPAADDVRGNIRLRTRGTAALTDRLVVDDVSAAITGRLALNNAVTNATQVTIVDDAVTTFTPARTGGFLMLTAGGNVGAVSAFEPHSANIFFDVGTTAAFCAKNTGIVGVGGQVDCVTGTTLTGTTGTDGNVTVSARTDGTLMVENRRGFSTTFTLWVM